jgi:hypothetical protein
MECRREELQAKLVEHYRSCGFTPRVEDDGTVRAAGIGGVTWIGLAVVADDLADVRMPAGQLCPLELLPAEECTAAVTALLAQLRLERRGHVEVYSLAA